MNSTMSGGANPIIQQRFAEAQALEARGDLAGAEAGYRQLLATMPGQPLLLAISRLFERP